MKKRINVTDQVFDKLVAMAAELGMSGVKQNEKVEKLFNDNILFEKMERCVAELSECRNENEELKKDKIRIDEEQLKRVEKLQAIGILDDNLSDALRVLIDSFVEAQADKIRESVLKI